MDFLSALLDFIRLLCQVLSLAIIIRIILSWFAPRSANTFSIILYRITEPVLAPLRRIIPRAGMFDFSPLAAIIILQLIVQITYKLP